MSVIVTIMYGNTKRLSSDEDLAAVEIAAGQTHRRLQQYNTKQHNNNNNNNM